VFVAQEQSYVVESKLFLHEEDRALRNAHAQVSLPLLKEAVCDELE
jgi:hypothetical protein